MAIEKDMYHSCLYTTRQDRFYNQSFYSYCITQNRQYHTAYSKEFDILYFLISHKEQVFTKEQIYENVWGYDYPADPNNLTSFIRKLRKKIEPEPDRPRYIVIVRGVGYKYTENEEMVGKTATPPE